MIDLHSHTLHSDGKLNPEQLLAYAAECGIKTLAVTDHDTVAGVETAMDAARSHGITLIPGVELTVNWQKYMIHIIGLQIDVHNPALIAALEQQAQIRATRALKIADKLALAGINNAYEGAKLLAKDANITRAHFAEFLVAQKHVKDIQSAFKRYLATGKVAYVTGAWLSLETALTLIHAASGVAVVAHPLRYGFTMSKLKKLLEQFKQLGGKGMEVISGKMQIEEINQLASLCRAYDLLASVGSDFHGEGLTTIKMGTLPQLPAACTPIWHAWSSIE